MALRLFQYVQGTTLTASSTVQLLPSGLAGTLGAKRRLVHPDSSVHPPIVYFANPDRTFNFSKDVLRHPITAPRRTLATTRTIRFEELEEDVIVTERWEARGGLAVPLFFFDWLYEYLVNPPAFDATNQQYIQWEPRDDSDDVFDIELLSFQVGPGQPGRFSMKKYVTRGGPSDPVAPGVANTPSESYEVSPTAFIDQPMELRFKIVGKV